MKSFFEHLRKKGVLSRSGVNKSSIDKLTKIEIIDLSEQLLDICSSLPQKHQPTTFRHFASLSLGGGIEECYSLKCRLKKIDQLARFAVLYSDRVYIRNFLGDYVHLKHRPKIKLSDKLSERLYNDLCLIMYIRPLIEEGHIAFVSPMKHMCPHCFVRHYGLDPNLAERLIQARKKLAQEYFANTTVKFCYFNNLYSVECTGPESLYEHGFWCMIFDKLPRSLKVKPRLLQKLKKTGKLAVSPTFQRGYKHHEFMAAQVTSNIYYELSTNKILDTSFVTHNPLHISFLKAITNDIEIERRNNIAFENLTTQIPFISDVSIRNLLKLRQREQEGFIVFRAALNEAIAEFANRHKEFTRNTARVLYGDIIAPSLAKLDREVKKAKRDLVSRARRAVLGTVGALSFGLYTGLVDANVGAIAAAIGLAKLASDIRKVMALGNAENVIQNEDLYFLWKVKEKSK